MGGAYQETWKVFGDELEKYIEVNKKDFIDDSYDLIIGFSRGGTILAFVISCILKDKFEEYAKPHKASVRPIPKGLSIKRDNPCFVMNLPTSDHEDDDLKNNLNDDLEEFAKIHNNSELLNILLVDDNLTGGTRLTYLGNKLKENSWVKSYKLLAYNHHPEFRNPQINKIKKFPENKDYFIMPWHTEHPKKNLISQDDEDYTKLIFYISVSNEFNLDNLYEKLKTDYIVKRNEANAKIFSVKNGASIFNIKKDVENNIIELGYTTAMFYPPKHCLKEEGEENNTRGAFDKSLCYFTQSKFTKTKMTCLLCSYLNCNIPLIKKILTFEETEQTSLCIKEIGPKDKINKSLKPATEKWFESLIPLKIVQNQNEL